MDESASDEELMLRYRDGEALAFETLYRRHRGPLYRYFIRLVRPAAVAEELFQDVWTNVIRARLNYEARARFTTWLYRLAHNRLVDHYRRQNTALPVSNDDLALEQVSDDSWREPENEFERRRLGQRVAELLDTLPAAQREVFLLRVEGEMTLEEIAAVGDIDVEAAKSRLRYALAKLRIGLGDARPQQRQRDGEN